MPRDRATLNALMDRASSGDDDAFGALASAVQDELFRLALALGLRRDDAAEVTQEVLLRAYARRATWRSGADALAWLCGMVVNVVRENQRQRRAAPQERDWSELSEVASSTAAFALGEFDPEQLQYLQTAVAELPPRQREAIACRYLRRMSLRETAAVMGCAEGTVKSAVSAALERLRGILEKHV